MSGAISVITSLSAEGVPGWLILGFGVSVAVFGCRITVDSITVDLSL